jgi:hypothetical protein
LDEYKIQLGLPPDVEVVIRDPFLDRFQVNDPQTVVIQNEVGVVLDDLRDAERIADKPALQAKLDLLLKQRAAVKRQLAEIGHEQKRLVGIVPARLAKLRELQQRPEVLRGEVDPAIVSEDGFRLRVARLTDGLPQLTGDLETIWRQLEQVSSELPKVPLDSARKRSVTLVSELSSILLAMSLDQAATRVESIDLLPIHLDPPDALEIARENRLDWMNARARLVDAWRLIEFDANALQSGLNIVFDGDIGTIGDNPTRFRGTTGQLRGGVAFDSPLTRLAERNTYRETLIDYQRARRDYMLFEDRINQSLRNTLRVVELSQINFEIARSSIYVSFAQVDLSRLRLNLPPKPGEVVQFGSTTARDLLSALSDLLNSQNDLLNIWVNYEVLRMLLAFELGVMQIDEQGLWIDTGVPASSPSAIPRMTPPPEPAIAPVP